MLGSQVFDRRTDIWIVTLTDDVVDLVAALGNCNAFTQPRPSLISDSWFVKQINEIALPEIFPK